MQLLVKDLIDQGADLHYITPTSDTPFVGLLLELFELLSHLIVVNHDGWVTSSVSQKGSLLLKIWLECLQKSGVDLTEYGRKETKLHQEGLVVWYGLDSRLDIRWLLRNLTYGPSPCDWKLDMELRYEATLESQGNMPGGWIEDGYCEGKLEFCLRGISEEAEAEVETEEKEKEAEEVGGGEGGGGGGGREEKDEDEDDGDKIEERDSYGVHTQPNLLEVS